MTDKVKCTDCRHAFRKLSSLPIWGSGVEWMCRREWVGEALEYNPVKGYETIPGHYMKCSYARAGYQDAPCGKEGRNWEPKDKKNFFMYLNRI